MTDNVLYGIDFSAKRERDHAEFLLALSQAMAPDEVFVDERSCKSRPIYANPMQTSLYEQPRSWPDKDSA